MKTNTLKTAVLLPFLFLACSKGPAAEGAAKTAVYFGPSRFSSADGKVPYGGTTSAAKREVSADGSLITETLTQPGGSPAVPPSTYLTTMKRRGASLVYDTQDAGKTFTGTLTYSDAGLNSWTYDIKLAAGGVITGTGAINQGALTTKKVFAGTKAVLITDELKEIPQAEYERVMAAMLPK